MMRRLMPTPLKDIPLTAKEQKDFDEKMLRLYAFPVHSASVERLWSELGGVLTKTRNRTAFKAFRIVKVRSQLRCKRKAELPAAGAALRLQQRPQHGAA